MDSPSTASLERFVRANSARFLGQTAGRVSATVQMWIGAGFLVAGLGLASLLLATGRVSVVGCSLGFIIPGAVNLAAGIAMRQRFAMLPRAAVSLSNEASQLLRRLQRKYGPWGMGYGDSDMTADFLASGKPQRRKSSPKHAARAALQHESYVQDSASLTPPEEVLDLLERSAFQYNRISGMIASGDARSESLSRMMPRIGLAADEAIAEILHLSAMFGQFPEAGAATRARIEERTQTLHELAERMESLVAQEPSLMDRAVNRTSIDDVLDELRMEQLARHELRSEPLEERRTSQDA